jgi:hypothetical protein
MGDIRKRVRRFSFAFAATVAACTFAVPARADESRAAIDWMDKLVQLDQFVRTGSERPQLTLPARGTSDRPVTTTSTEPYEQNAGNAWFGVAPRVSFVARDWATSLRLAGDRLSLVDAMRLSQSTRMIVTRVRFGDLRVSRVTPFAQVGLGQWRTDTNIMPLTPRSTEIAGQAGGGIEIQISRTWQLAAETSVTALYREQREDTSIPQTRFWGAMLASRFEF